MKWTKELLDKKWIIVNSQEEAIKVSEFLKTFGLSIWGSYNYNEQRQKIKDEDDVIIYIDPEDNDYFITSYKVQNTLKIEDKIFLDDLFPEETLKSKLLDLFNKPETIFYVRSKEEGAKLDRLYYELGYCDELKNIFENWYDTKIYNGSYTCEYVYTSDWRNAKNNHKNDNVTILTFDNLLDYVK